MWLDTLVLNYALKTALYSLSMKCRIPLFKMCMTSFLNPPLQLSSKPFHSRIGGWFDVDYRTFETDL